MSCALPITNATTTMTECGGECIAALSHTGHEQGKHSTGCALIAATDRPHSVIAPTQLPLSAALRTPIGVHAHSVAVVVHLHHPFFAPYKNLKPRPASSPAVPMKGLPADD